MKGLLFCLLIGSYQALAIEFDQYMPADAKAQFIQDLEMVKQIKGSQQTPLHKRIYEHLDGHVLYKFLEDRIRTVGFDICDGSTTVSACVMLMVDPKTMWITPNYLEASYTQATRILTIFHEARHMEASNGYWSHATCPTPFLDDKGKDVVGFFTGEKMEGLDACDETAFGSYGSSTILMKNLAKYCTNCTEKFKMDADLLAENLIDRLHIKKVRKQVRADFKK